MGLFWETSPLHFWVLTVAIGGGAAWLAGRALAQSWRPYWQVLAYMLILGVAVRFFHFALLEGTLLSLKHYLVDTAVLIVISALSYRIARTTQMVTQYPWLYRRSSPLSWSANND